MAQRGEFLQRIGNRGEIGRVEPTPLHEKPCHNTRFDPVGAVCVFDEQLSFPTVEAMRKRLGIEHPVLGDAVLLVLRELRTHVSIGGPRAQHLHHEIGGSFDVGVAATVGPIGTMEGEIGKERVPGAQPNGDYLSIEKTEAMTVDVHAEQTVEQIEQIGMVSRVDYKNA